MAIMRVKARWSGFTGAPGYSVLHFNDSIDTSVYTPTAAVAATRAFFNGLTSLLPATVKIDIDTAVDVLDPLNGKITDIATATAAPQVVGTQTGTYSAPTGAVVHWLTSGVRNGRRVRGKTFLVPLSNIAYQADGTLATGNISTIETAAQALIDDANSALVCYARPTKGGNDGQQHLVTGRRVPDLATVLRSRRD